MKTATQLAKDYLGKCKPYQDIKDLAAIIDQDRREQHEATLSEANRKLTLIFDAAKERKMDMETAFLFAVSELNSNDTDFESSQEDK